MTDKENAAWRMLHGAVPQMVEVMNAINLAEMLAGEDSEQVWVLLHLREVASRLNVVLDGIQRHYA